MKLFFLLVFFTSLFATVNEPFRMQVFSGYRNDRIHWHLQEAEGGALTYSELDRNVQYWENGLAFKAIHKDLTFWIRGDYGTFGRGEAFEEFAGESTFQTSTEGWTADAAGYFGYAVNLTADRTYQVLLTPLIGYSGYWEQLKRDGQEFKLVWNGFFFGGSLGLNSGGPLLWTLGYSYHLLHNSARASFQTQSMKSSSGGNGGHTGWAEIDWALHPAWRLGIGADIHYFFTRTVNASVQEDVSQKFKLRWTPIAGWLQIARFF